METVTLIGTGREIDGDRDIEWYMEIDGERDTELYRESPSIYLAV